MSNQDILNTLSTLESVFYYRKDGSDDLEGVSIKKTEEIHKILQRLVVDWHLETGLTLN